MSNGRSYENRGQFNPNWSQGSSSTGQRGRSQKGEQSVREGHCEFIRQHCRCSPGSSCSHRPANSPGRKRTRDTIEDNPRDAQADYGKSQRVGDITVDAGRVRDYWIDNSSADFTYKGSQGRDKVHRRDDRSEQSSGSRTSLVDRGSQHRESKGRDHYTRCERARDQHQERNNKSRNRPGESEPSDTVCDYCGGIILHTNAAYKEDNKDFHKQCLKTQNEKREAVVDAFIEVTRKDPVLWMAIPVTHLYGCKSSVLNKQGKRVFRDIKATELLNNASALRNSNSGHLLIQLVGLNPKDNFTGAFDEFADVKLQSLINDGSLFDDVYKKTRLSEYPGLEQFTDILVLYVEGADFLITSDFKTKVALDDCIIDTPDLTLLKFIQNGRITEKKFQNISAQCAEDLLNLQESRHIQTKAYCELKEDDATLVSNIFERLRAAEYISAFSKNKEGGSYFLGLAEKTREFKEYQSKVLEIKPVVIDNEEIVKNLIQKRVSATCLVCDYAGKELAEEDFIKIFLIPSSDRLGRVVHIAVSSVNGITFYDKSGPLAFRVDKKKQHSVVRYTLNEWFKAFRHGRSVWK